MLPSSLYNSPSNIFLNGCMVFKLGEKQISALCIFVSQHSVVFCTVRKMSLGYNVDLELMAERFEDCKRISEPFMKLPCPPNCFLRSISSFL